MRKKYQSYWILSARTVSATGPWILNFSDKERENVYMSKCNPPNGAWSRLIIGGGGVAPLPPPHFRCLWTHPSLLVQCCDILYCDISQHLFRVCPSWTTTGAPAVVTQLSVTTARWISWFFYYILTNTDGGPGSGVGWGVQMEINERYSIIFFSLKLSLGGHH